jgi:hypothetical protein
VLAPVASFQISAVSATQAILDANGSYDDRSARSALQFRWDFDNDGTWDTAFSMQPMVTHTFGSAGAQTVQLEVEDEVGNIAHVTRRATLADPTFVTGAVTTTTWSGVVVLTGSVSVASGQTLTIAPGTEILASYVAAASPAVPGDGGVSINVSGALDVQGTADAPVLFSMYQSTHRRSRSWAGITQSGAATLKIHYATIEYAVTGLQNCTSGTSDLGDTILQLSGAGASVGISATGCLSTGNDTFTRVTSLLNDGVGLNIGRGSMTFSLGTIAYNGGLGISADSSGTSLGIAASLITANKQGGVSSASTSTTLLNSVISDNSLYGYVAVDQTHSIQNSTLERNDYGVVVRGCAILTMNASVVDSSRKEALALAQAQTCSFNTPTVTVTGNNLTNSATCGGAVHAGKLNLSASLNVDQTWASPDGEVIDWAGLAYYNETNASANVYLRDGAGDQIFTTGYYANLNFWLDTSPWSPTELVLQVRNASASWILGETFYHSTLAPRSDLLAIALRVPANLSGNYWSDGSPVAVSSQIVGAAYDTSGALTSAVVGAGSP